MKHFRASTPVSFIASAVLAGLLFWSIAARGQETYPEFNRKYWADAQSSAKGKIVRGAILGAVGIASIAPSAILAVKAGKNPRKFLAYSVVSGIATLGLTFHGFFSINTGAAERDRAAAFVRQYDTDPSTVDPAEERSVYLDSEMTSTRKMVLFGAVLGVQGAVLLANGIALSIRKHKGLSIGDIKIWPSYLLSGLLLGGGGAFLGIKSARYKQLGDLEHQAPPVANGLLLRPYITTDPLTAAVEGGLLGQYSF